MLRLAHSRLMLATLLLLPCSLVAWHQLPHREQWTTSEDELTAPVCLPLARDIKPTIVRPSEHWIEEANSVDLKATSGPALELDREPPDRRMCRTMF